MTGVRHSFERVVENFEKQFGENCDEGSLGQQPLHTPFQAFAAAPALSGELPDGLLLVSGGGPEPSDGSWAQAVEQCKL